MNKSKAGLISSGIGTNDNQIFPIETRQDYHHGHHVFVAVNYQSSDVLLQGLSYNQIRYIIQLPNAKWVLKQSAITSIQIFSLMVKTNLIDLFLIYAGCHAG